MQLSRAFVRRAIFRSIISGWLLLAFVRSSGAQERLVLIGGGGRPAAAIARFVEWARGESAQILVITWATQDPKDAFASISKDFAPFHPKSIELAPVAPLNSATREQFLLQLKNATGVFFTGGDQARIMNVLKDATLLEALRARYHAGVVFGGTSAGTAIMSKRMITGEGDFTVIDGAKVQTSEGLGLLPADTIVDQHFIKRQRENRLFGLLLARQARLGVGIDENTALLVTDNARGEVVGASQVMLIDARRADDSLTIYLLRAGARIDLSKGVVERNNRRETMNAK
jgi:cyanophycinase